MYIIASIIFIVFLIVIFLHINHYRIYYLNLKKLFPGKYRYDEVGKYYDNWTDKFIKSGYKNVIQAHRSENIEETLDYIIKSAGINDGMHILDAGCGVCGPAIYFAAKKNITVDCVTNSKVQKEIAEKEIEKNNLSHRVKVHHMDYHQLEKLFAEKSFDLVYFLESYGHATGQTRLLKGVHRVLKLGGSIYIKDYFAAETYDNNYKNLRMALGIKNMNKVYRYNMADLYHTIYTLRHLQMQLIKIQRPSFGWDNDKTLMDFEIANGINLFEGKEVVSIVSPLELLFTKESTG